VASVGSLLLLVSACLTSVGLLVGGRVLAGVVYEPLDAIWVPLLSPLFPGSAFMLVSSLANAGQRAGSLLAFTLSPLLHRAIGLEGAILLPCALGVALLPLASVLSAASGAAASRRGDAVLRELEAPSDESSTGEPRASRGARSVAASVLLALGQFPRRFWVFCASVTCLYSAVVPFWFFGSKVLQLSHGLSLAEADLLLLLPELLLFLLSPPLGLLCLRLQPPVSQRFAVVAAMQLFVGGAYLGLAASPMPPTPLLAALGAAWAVTHTLVWGSLPAIVPAPLLALGTGMLGSAVNLGPACIPLAAGAGRGSGGHGAAGSSSLLLLLTACAAGATAGFVLLFRLARRSECGAECPVPDDGGARLNLPEMPEAVRHCMRGGGPGPGNHSNDPVVYSA